MKTHKTDWPYRFIMSSRGTATATATATEYLARWIEFKLKPYAQLHDSYIKDTKSFLKYIQTINETKAPLGLDTTLNSWDAVNFYPNCNTEMCINAVRRVAEENPQIDIEVLECVLEALEITMSSNNGSFANNFFTQINGATIGGPQSASVTDITNDVCRFSRDHVVECSERTVSSCLEPVCLCWRRFGRYLSHHLSKSESKLKFLPEGQG